MAMHLTDPDGPEPDPPITLTVETVPVPNPSFAADAFRATRID